MSFEILLLSCTILLSESSAKVTRCNAKNDKASDATLVYRTSKTIPDNTSGLNKIADHYRLEIYSEENNISTIPLSIVGRAIRIYSPSTIQWNESNQETVSYSGAVSVTSVLQNAVQAEFDLSGFAKLTAGITESVSPSLSFGLSYSRSFSESMTYRKYIDGETNPFGIYVFCYCTLSSSQYYFYYTHTKYNNYDKQEMYQTKLVYEDVDAHVFLSNTDAFLLSDFHFDTESDYLAFLRKYHL